MRPRRILRSSCWVSLGTGCLRHPQLVRITSTLRGDARSATKFCPGGSPGGSSASAPLRRRPGEGKHSLPPPASLYKGVLLASPRAPELWGLKEQPPPPDEARKLRLFDQSINLFQSDQLGDAGGMACRPGASAQHRRTEKFARQQCPPLRQAGGRPGFRRGALPRLCQQPSKSSIRTVARWLGLKAGSKGREQEGEQSVVAAVAAALNRG